MDILSVSQKTLTEIQSLQTLNTENFSNLCKYFLQTVIRGHSTIEIDESLEISLSGLSTLLLEAAKVRADPQQIKDLFVEHSLSSDIAGLVVDLYTQHGDSIISHLESTGISAPAIVDIDWRLDYSVRSKHGGRNNTPMYFVTLKVKDRGLLRNVDMMASLEEMQDLLASVRDAVKEVDRIMSTTE
mmetsp:Transcript_14526/g.21874  ORF Transcript_14526/g.21874 Transcript_14526/m.21874 type:complete len:186 (+) Transcript_14526:126-683(+)